MPVEHLRDLVERWATAYDWRAVEARLNEFPQFTTEIDGQDIHFLHVRSPHGTRCRCCSCTAGPGRSPSSSTVIEPLTDPARTRPTPSTW